MVHEHVKRDDIQPHLCYDLFTANSFLAIAFQQKNLKYLGRNGVKHRRTFIQQWNRTQAIECRYGSASRWRHGVRGRAIHSLTAIIVAYRAESGKLEAPA